MSKHTPGPWSVAKPSGWLSTCIVAPSRDGVNERPILSMTKPKAYYTDFPTRVDDNGERWTVCSTEAAIKAGNYVATDEIKAEIDAQEMADARLIAQAPRLLEALEFIIDRFGPCQNDYLFSKRLALDKARAAIAAATEDDSHD